VNAFTGVLSFTSAMTLPAHIGRRQIKSLPEPEKASTSEAIAAFRRAATRGTRSRPCAVAAAPTKSAPMELASAATAGAYDSAT
jgi:hypothetical protein